MTTDTKLATRAPTPVEGWKMEMYHEKTLANLSKALMGTGYAPERFAHTAYMLVAKNPKLLVNKPQLWLGVYAAAECGLSLQTHMQQMFLVPFGKEVTPIIGAQGFVYLIGKAGLGLLSPPVLVFQRDVEEHRFKYRQGTRAICELDPVVRDPSRPKGELRYAFAVYEAANGRKTFKCMERSEILEIRDNSKGWKAYKAGRASQSTWEATTLPDGSESGNFLPMSAKTVIRHFAKALPKSTDHWGERAAKAEAVEAELDGQPTDVLSEVLDVTVEQEAQKPASEKLRERLKTPDPDEMARKTATARVLGDPSEEEKAEILRQEHEAAKQ
jgi:recombination protein RecT